MTYEGVCVPSAWPQTHDCLNHYLKNVRADNDAKRENPQRLSSDPQTLQAGVIKIVVIFDVKKH